MRQIIYKYTIHLAIIFLVIISFAPNTKSAENKKSSLIENLNKRSSVLERKISNESNPEKRKKYIKLLYQTQEYYLKGNTRREMVRQNYPELVKQAEYYDALPKKVKAKRLEDSIEYQMSQSSMVIKDFETSWARLSELEKQKVCKASSKMCLEGEKNMKCKFVLIRCKFIIEDSLYNKVKKHVRNKAAETASRTQDK